MTEQRKELFSEKVSTGSRTYFFDVKESVSAAKYLVITESRKSGEGAFEHTRVMVFQEDVPAFNEAYNKALEFMNQEGGSTT